MFGNDQQNNDDAQANNDYMNAIGQSAGQDDVKSSGVPVDSSDNSLPGSIDDPTPPADTTLPDTSANDNTTAPEAPASFDNTSNDDSSRSTQSQTPSFTPISDGDDLLDIKKNALSQLGPLVGHLDQTPEEKFRTMMMMIQATDDQSMVQAAYDAAQAITDDKVRAQALLDVVNEINYFTHQQKS